MINTRYFNISYLAIIIIILIICYSSYNKYKKETFTNINIDELYKGITGHIPIDIKNWNIQHTYGEVTNEGMEILNEAFNHHGPLDNYDIPNKTFYDLGCGVGKLIITIANNNPKINSVGYEILTDRVNKGKTVLNKIQDKKLLDRINGDIEKTKNKYKEDTTHWEEFFDDMIGVSKGKDQQPVEVKLIFNKEQAPYIKTKPLHSTQKDKILENGFLEIRINVVLNYELEMKILSYGEKVKVIAPETLVNKIKKSIELLFKNY